MPGFHTLDEAVTYAHKSANRWNCSMYLHVYDAALNGRLYHVAAYDSSPHFIRPAIRFNPRKWRRITPARKAGRN